MNNTPNRLPAIQINNLTKRFEPAYGIKKFFGNSILKEPVTAVDQVDLRVEKGELFGLLGPNGAGKTTLVKILCTLIVPTSGNATVDGHDIVEGEALVRRSIGLVGSEERSFYWRLTGRQNLEFFCALHNLYGRRMHERIEEILELLGLSAVADRMFQTYSTGMKQKMCIARGLLTDPTILFLDEPTRSLDPIAAESIRCFIKETLVRRQGRTVVLTTHRLEEAAQVCDRIAIMDKGRIKGCGSLSELRTILGSSCRYQLDTTEIPQGVAESLHRIGGVENLEMRERRILFSSPWAQNALPDVITALVKGGVSILNCRVDEITLDEIFSCLVSEEGAPEYASQALGIS